MSDALVAVGIEYEYSDAGKSWGHWRYTEKSKLTKNMEIYLDIMHCYGCLNEAADDGILDNFREEQHMLFFGDCWSALCPPDAQVVTYWIFRVKEY